jgi:hypothetical protein
MVRGSLAPGRRVFEEGRERGSTHWTADAVRFLASLFLFLAATGAQPVLAQSVTKMVSASPTGGEGNGDSLFTVLSEDGNLVLFASSATNLLATKDENGTKRDIFLRDIEKSTTTLISRSTAGAQSNDASSFPSMSSNGNRIAFETKATNFNALDANGNLSDIYVHDRAASTTSLISVSSLQEQGNAASTNPHISSDGRFVTFLGTATNLAGEDKNGAVPDVFLRDLQTQTTSIISIDSAGLQDASLAREGATHAVVSREGRFVAFATDSKLIENDTNDTSDIYLRDVAGGTTTIVSRALRGGAAGKSTLPAMDPEARFVAFESSAGNLVDGVTGGTQGVYVLELASGTLRLASRARSGEPASGPSLVPAMSPDGAWVSFVSTAGNLVANDRNEASDVFLHEITSGFTTRVSVGNGAIEGNAPSETGFFGVARAGSVVAFRSRATNLLDPVDPGQSTTPGRSHIYVRVTVPDTFPPVVKCGSDVILECQGQGGSVGAYDVKVFDDSDPAPVLVCDPPPGSTFPPGVTKVTCTATDSFRNSASCSFQVTVTDTTPPAINCAANVRVTLPPGRKDMRVDFDAPRASDSCGQTPAVTCTPASGTIFPLGTTSVTCKATDSGNLTSQCQFQVTVIEGTPPVVSCPGPIEVECQGGGGMNVNFTATATDDTDPSPVILCNPPSGSFFPVGVTTVTCTARDAAGNVGTCLTEVRVVDRTAPTIACPADISALCSSPDGRRVNYVIDVDDGCDPSPAVVCDRPPGSMFPEGVTAVNCTATDSSGNTRSCSFNVRISSDEPLFYRGDANRDDRITISDPVFSLLALFLGEELPPCDDAADVDDNGKFDVTDPIYLLRFLFQGGSPVPPPGVQEIGPDPTPDPLGCSDPVC